MDEIFATVTVTA